MREATLNDIGRLIVERFDQYGTSPWISRTILDNTLVGMIWEDTPVFCSPQAAAHWFNPQATVAMSKNAHVYYCGEDTCVVSEVGYWEGDTWIDAGWIAHSV